MDSKYSMFGCSYAHDNSHFLANSDKFPNEQTKVSVHKNPPYNQNVRIVLNPLKLKEEVSWQSRQSRLLIYLQNVVRLQINVKRDFFGFEGIVSLASINWGEDDNDDDDDDGFFRGSFCTPSLPLSSTSLTVMQL